MPDEIISNNLRPGRSKMIQDDQSWSKMVPDDLRRDDFGRSQTRWSSMISESHGLRWSKCYFLTRDVAHYHHHAGWDLVLGFLDPHKLDALKGSASCLNWFLGGPVSILQWFWVDLISILQQCPWRNKLAWNTDNRLRTWKSVFKCECHIVKPLHPPADFEGCC